MQQCLGCSSEAHSMNKISQDERTISFWNKHFLFRCQWGRCWQLTFGLLGYLDSLDILVVALGQPKTEGRTWIRYLEHQDSSLCFLWDSLTVTCIYLILKILLYIHWIELMTQMHTQHWFLSLDRTVTCHLGSTIKSSFPSSFNY